MIVMVLRLEVFNKESCICTKGEERDGRPTASYVKELMSMNIEIEVVYVFQRLKKKIKKPLETCVSHI